MSEDNQRLKQARAQPSIKPDDPQYAAGIEALRQELYEQELASREARLELQKQLLDAKKPEEKQQPWWVTLTTFLALPALLVVMFLQFNQAGSERQDVKQSQAEAQLAITQELKARADLEITLSDLERKKAKGVAEYQAALDAAVPQLQSLLSQLERSRAGSNSTLFLYKFVILWAVWHGLGMVFNIIHSLWNATVGLVTGAVFSYHRHGRPSARLTRIRTIVQFAIPALYAVPSILNWAVHIFVFAALIVPLFNEVAVALGSQTTFTSIVESARALNLGEAVEKIRGVIFP